VAANRRKSSQAQLGNVLGVIRAGIAPL